MEFVLIARALRYLLQFLVVCRRSAWSNYVADVLVVEEQVSDVVRLLEERRRESSLVDGHLAESALLCGLLQNVLLDRLLTDQTIDRNVSCLTNLEASRLPRCVTI